LKQCVYNPLFYGQFCWPDHDMVQSKPGQNSCPTLPLIQIHMVSGGPIYFADEVGETDGKVIEKVSFPDGRLPRLDTVGMPTIDIIFTNSDKNAPAKMWNYHDLSGGGRIFYEFVGNIAQETVIMKTSVGLKDFGVERNVDSAVCSTFMLKPSEFAIKEYESSQVQVVSEKNNSESITLEQNIGKYYQISPIINGIALFGIKEVYNGTKAIHRITGVNKQSICIELDYAGTLQIFKQPNLKLKVKSLDGQSISATPNVQNPNLLEIPAKTTVILDWD
jgi:hypothetical protein